MESCSSALTALAPRGMSNASSPFTVLPGVDVVQEHATSPGPVDVDVRARDGVVLPAAGVIDILAGVIQRLGLAADVGHSDMQDGVLPLGCVTEAISGIPGRLSVRDGRDGELELPVPYRGTDRSGLLRRWRPVSRCPTATRMDGMDLVALAEAMDCDGARADSPAALEKALSGFAARSRPLIVEARVDPAQYEAQF